MKFILSTLLMLILASFWLEGICQAADFVVVKKKGRSYKTFLKGTYTSFFTTEGEYIQGRILDIRNDSLFFREIIIRQVPTQWGVTRLDTVATPVRSIHYQNIRAIPRQDHSFSYIKNGTLLMIGGGGYILLNLVNGAYLHDPPFSKKNLPGMATATGVLAAGFVMSKLHKPSLRIEKKYTIHYINLTTPKR